MRTINLMILMAEVLMVPAWGVEATPYWPQFHGPLRNNLSTETGLLKQWSPEGPPLKWTARGIGQGYSSVSLAHNRIYTSGNINGKTVISALGLTGRTAWQETIGDGWISKKNYPGTRATPTLLGKRLFYMSPIGEVVCLDALSGKKIWGFNVLERFNSQPPRWGLAESIVIYDGRVFCCPGGPETAVVALDLETGRVLWKSPSTGDLAGYATVTVAEYKGVPMIITMTAKAVIGVHAGNGELLWRYAHETPYDMNVQRPVYHRGRVLISSVKTGAVMLEIEVRGGACSVKPVWTSTDLDNHHGGVTLLDGYVYGSCWHRGWSCLEWETGKTMYYERRLDKGSLTYADGHFYVLSEKRKMSLVKAVPQAYEAVSEFPLPDAGQGFSWARPVVCGGILYIRHDDFLYAYDVREPTRNMLKNPSFESGEEWKPMGPATSIVPGSAYTEAGTQCRKIVLDPNRYKQQRYQDVKSVRYWIRNIRNRKYGLSCDIHSLILKGIR